MQLSWRGSAACGVAAAVGGVCCAWALWAISPDRFVIVFLVNKTNLKKMHHDGTARAPRWWALDSAEPAARPEGWGNSVLAAQKNPPQRRTHAPKKKRRPQFSILAHFSPPAQENPRPPPHPPPAIRSWSARRRRRKLIWRVGCVGRGVWRRLRRRWRVVTAKSGARLFLSLLPA